MPLSGRRIFPNIPPVTVFFLFLFLLGNTGHVYCTEHYETENMSNNTEHFPLCIEYCLYR